MLKVLIRELTEYHQVNSGINAAIDLRTAEPLLLQLLNAKRRRENGNPGTSTQASPLPLDPLLIEQDIIRTIHYTASPHHRYELASLPLAQRVRRWVEVVDEPTAEAFAQEWVDRINALFRTYQDLAVACPRCGATHVLVDEGDQTIRKAAIGVCKETLTATCRNWECGALWVGEDELRNLSHHAPSL